MKFYLGTHQSDWLGVLDVPLFVSNRRLMVRKGYPRAKGRWALDSGGFSELNLYGKWMTSPKEYVALTERYIREVGNLDWAASQDWMCEPVVLAKTGKTVREHQELTIANYLELKSMAPHINYIPVIQGWVLKDYLKHVEMYYKEGVDLSKLDTVGVGSVCRRQAKQEIADIMKALKGLDINLHGFGVKKEGLANTKNDLLSADSMAWSVSGRYDGPLEECTHKHCGNCIKFALKWYNEIIDTL